jgi:hypothetical protein
MYRGEPSVVPIHDAKALFFDTNGSCPHLVPDQEIDDAANSTAIRLFVRLQIRWREETNVRLGHAFTYSSSVAGASVHSRRIGRNILSGGVSGILCKGLL